MQAKEDLLSARVTAANAHAAELLNKDSALTLKASELCALHTKFLGLENMISNVQGESATFHSIFGKITSMTATMGQAGASGGVHTHIHIHTHTHSATHYPATSPMATLLLCRSLPQ